MRHRKITEHIVRSLKPRNDRYGISEDGLTVEVQPSGKKSFYCKYRQHRVQHKEFLGACPGPLIQTLAQLSHLAKKHRSD